MVTLNKLGWIPIISSISFMIVGFMFGMAGYFKISGILFLLGVVMFLISIYSLKFYRTVMEMKPEERWKPLGFIWILYSNITEKCMSFISGNK